MTDGFNSRCEMLKRKIIDSINDSKLPIGAIYYIYKSIYSEIENTYYGSLNDEAQDIEVHKKDSEALEEVMNTNE